MNKNKLYRKGINRITAIDLNKLVLIESEQNYSYIEKGTNNSYTERGQNNNYIGRRSKYGI